MENKGKYTKRKPSPLVGEGGGGAVGRGKLEQKQKNKGMTLTEKPSPLVGEGGGGAVGRGKCEQKRKCR